MNQNESYYPRHPYKIQRQTANVRERKRMLRSVPRSEYEKFVIYNITQLIFDVVVNFEKHPILKIS